MLSSIARAVAVAAMSSALNVAPGGSQVPSEGLSCGGSDHTLGETWPPNASPSRNQPNDVVDIKALVVSSASPAVFGWLYFERDGHVYVEGAYNSATWRTIADFLLRPPDVAFANGGDLLPLSGPMHQKLSDRLGAIGGSEMNCFVKPLDAQP
jgi:hypothetical protein